ncbi:ribbon-helix-helix domain-containing protein [Candidatus Bathycorpusculum sp.]|uniref:ribbon-helix-helix domain-containing protein n=1 Tax=Candidatus Bathycorpusculum sp. TaxID=2994959 RepID=UPI00282445E0|nr:ribbon-helix-helix domain-containing protein [Candidatus Termitimicrobium sp.]MCL2432174.1 ribbon-helix-helix domain-containing protein [Candidatus Termitimicrobium sp.]
MKTKQKNSNPTKIWLLVPKNFLQQFDTETKNHYTSRNEAIRSGMQLIRKEIAHQNQTNQHHNQTPPTHPS